MVVTGWTGRASGNPRDRKGRTSPRGPEGLRGRSRVDRNTAAVVRADAAAAAAAAAAAVTAATVATEIVTTTLVGTTASTMDTIDLMRGGMKKAGTLVAVLVAAWVALWEVALMEAWAAKASDTSALEKEGVALVGFAVEAPTSE